MSSNKGVLLTSICGFTFTEFAMELAVKGMLPKNTIGRASMTRLKLYKGAEHKNAAQKPEAWTLD